MAFRFRLERVLRHRRRLVDLRSRDVAAAAARVAGIRRTIDDRRRDQERTAADAAAAGNVPDRQRRAAWITHLEGVIGRLEGECRAASRELETARAALHAAWRDREVLEQLRRRRHEEWQAENARRDRADLDEIGQQRAEARRRQHRSRQEAESADHPGTGKTVGGATDSNLHGDNALR